ncbi:MAG: FAD-dependent thymidylate synthase [Kiritimatiellae bacterium]|nr:FAD-dependent thymidylate synthase [Kiritimatiellia bacterium]
MRVTLVSLRPTEAADQAGRPALTPELLAATGARYSRSNDGLDAILARIDPARLDQSVDAIFRMLDYGHQSIADMAPVAMFMDGVSAWLAYYVWSLCPLAGGQESSTRYIRMTPESLLPPDVLGIPAEQHGAWHAAMLRAFERYERLYSGWQALGAAVPELVRLPESLRNDASERAARQAERIRRNYAFDRARYLLPAAIATNLMLVMSARAWAALCQHLSAQPLPEARRLGEAIRAELALGAPRLLRHAQATPALTQAVRDEFDLLSAAARQGPSAALRATGAAAAHPCTAHLGVCAPAAADGQAFAHDLRYHENRYAWIGPALRRTAVRFGWEAVAFAEIRDLNRHRTGRKHCPPLPLGFYAAADQLPQPDSAEYRLAPAEALSDAIATGQDLTLQAHTRLAAGDPSYVYWTLLGTQFAFEHVTTADEFIYEAELRTGTGAHFRYARHLHDALSLWYERYPETRGAILEGAAEPE